MDRDKYANYAALAAAQVEGRDYRVSARRVRGSKAVIAAPHAGGIEYRTSEIAKAVAGLQHSLYLFEGTLNDGNAVLHVTSHHFDEPRCLDLLKDHAVVVTIHGCANIGGDRQAVYVGGLDEDLKHQIAESLRDFMFDAHTRDHQFPGTEPMNICNRGATNRGVQLELSRGLREVMDIARFGEAVRNALRP